MKGEDKVELFLKTLPNMHCFLSVYSETFVYRFYVFFNNVQKFQSTKKTFEQNIRLVSEVLQNCIVSFKTYYKHAFHMITYIQKIK